MLLLNILKEAADYLDLSGISLKQGVIVKLHYKSISIS